ncbi:MAG: serine protease [Balneolaceae bacterium]
MKKLISIYLTGIFITISACTPVFTTKITETRAPQPDSTKILTYFVDDNIEGDLEVLGSIKVNSKNTGTCNSIEFNKKLLNEVRNAGGNSLILEKYSIQNRRLSNCSNLEGEIAYIDYKIDSTLFDESFLMDEWDNGFDDLEGIYESIGPSLRNLKLGIYKNTNGDLKLIHLGGIDGTFEHLWKHGNIRAELNATGTFNTFKAVWINENRTLNDNYIFSFRGGIMTLINSQYGFQQSFIKAFPAENKTLALSGTGFAISDKGYVVTNYHVIEGADQIVVKGINGDFSTKFDAEVVVSDINNDLAILKLDIDEGIIPYISFNLEESLSKLGKEVYALGYPLRNTMGDEIKLTNGVISSKTGFRGNVTLYQISVPIQPGNSGGPLFDSDGNIIGIISSKHPTAYDVSYAIKARYLQNLLDLLPENSVTLNKPSFGELPLLEKIEEISSFVYIIERE